MRLGADQDRSRRDLRDVAPADPAVVDRDDREPRPRFGLLDLVEPDVASRVLAKR